jgi:hypothetical protein
MDCHELEIMLPAENPSNLPLVFIGASPELEQQLDWLKKNQKSAYYLCSDTALGFMVENNIKPHGILSIDSGRGTYFHLMKEFHKDMEIYTWLGGCRELFQKNKPPKIFLTNYPLDQFISELYQLPDESILSNPSLNIAGMAIAIGRLWKMSEVYLAGFGLRSTQGKTHCRGTGYESYNLPLITRRKTMESLLPTRTYPSHLTHKNQNSLDNLNPYSFPVKFLSQNMEQNNNINIDPKYMKSPNFSPHSIYLEPPSPKSWHLISQRNLPGVDSKIMARYLESY